MPIKNIIKFGSKQFKEATASMLRGDPVSEVLFEDPSTGVPRRLDKNAYDDVVNYIETDKANKAKELDVKSFGKHIPDHQVRANLKRVKYEPNEAYSRNRALHGRSKITRVGSLGQERSSRVRELTKATRTRGQAAEIHPGVRGAKIQVTDNKIEDLNGRQILFNPALRAELNARKASKLHLIQPGIRKTKGVRPASAAPLDDNYTHLSNVQFTKDSGIIKLNDKAKKRILDIDKLSTKVLGKSRGSINEHPAIWVRNFNKDTYFQEVVSEGKRVFVAKRKVIKDGKQVTEDVYFQGYKLFAKDSSEVEEFYENLITYKAATAHTGSGGPLINNVMHSSKYQFRAYNKDGIETMYNPSATKFTVIAKDDTVLQTAKHEPGTYKRRYDASISIDDRNVAAWMSTLAYKFGWKVKKVRDNVYTVEKGNTGQDLPAGMIRNRSEKYHNSIREITGNIANDDRSQTSLHRAIQLMNKYTNPRSSNGKVYSDRNRVLSSKSIDLETGDSVDYYEFKVLPNDQRDIISKLGLSTNRHLREFLSKVLPKGSNYPANLSDDASKRIYDKNRQIAESPFRGREQVFEHVRKYFGRNYNVSRHGSARFGDLTTVRYHPFAQEFFKAVDSVKARLAVDPDATVSLVKGIRGNVRLVVHDKNIPVIPLSNKETFDLQVNSPLTLRLYEDTKRSAEGSYGNNIFGEQIYLDDLQDLTPRKVDEIISSGDFNSYMQMTKRDLHGKVSYVEPDRTLRAIPAERMIAAQIRILGEKQAYKNANSIFLIEDANKMFGDNLHHKYKIIREIDEGLLKDFDNGYPISDDELKHVLGNIRHKYPTLFTEKVEDFRALLENYAPYNKTVNGLKEKYREIFANAQVDPKQVPKQFSIRSLPGDDETFYKGGSYLDDYLGSYDAGNGLMYEDWGAVDSGLKFRLVFDYDAGKDITQAEMQGSIKNLILKMKNDGYAPAENAVPNSDTSNIMMQFYKVDNFTGPTHYIDRLKFKLKYNSKLTEDDYENVLKIFEGRNPTPINPVLAKMRRGEKLTKVDADKLSNYISKTNEIGETLRSGKFKKGSLKNTIQDFMNNATLKDKPTTDKSLFTTQEPAIRNKDRGYVPSPDELNFILNSYNKKSDIDPEFSEGQRLQKLLERNDSGTEGFTVDDNPETVLKDIEEITKAIARVGDEIEYAAQNPMELNPGKMDELLENEELLQDRLRDAESKLSLDVYDYQNAEGSAAPSATPEGEDIPNELGIGRSEVDGEGRNILDILDEFNF